MNKFSHPKIRWVADDTVRSNVASIVKSKLTYRFHKFLVLKLAEAMNTMEADFFTEENREALLAKTTPISPEALTLRQAVAQALGWHHERYIRLIAANYEPTLAPESGALLDDLAQSHLECSSPLSFYEDPVFSDDFVASLVGKTRFIKAQYDKSDAGKSDVGQASTQAKTGSLREGKAATPLKQSDITDIFNTVLPNGYENASVYGSVSGGVFGEVATGQFDPGGKPTLLH